MKATAEIRLACGILAALSVITSQILFFPALEIDALLPDSQQFFLGWCLLLTGALLISGLILRCRALRQWGLGLSGLAWLVLAVTLFNAWATWETTSAVAIVGLIYVYLLFRGVHGKPRADVYRIPSRE